MTKSSASTRERVLVVDDHDFSRNHTAAALRQAGGTVKQAGTADEAIAVCLAWLPDTVVVDWNLGSVTGGDFLQRLRRLWPADEKTPRAVLYSGETPETLPRGAAQLFDRVLTKPCEAAELAAQLGHTAGGVREANEWQGPEIRRLFLAELENCMRELEHLLAARQTAPASGITHQLIAGSLMVDEPELEQALRSLHSELKPDPDPARVADAWCRFRRAAGNCLAGIA